MASSLFKYWPGVFIMRSSPVGRLTWSTIKNAFLKRNLINLFFILDTGFSI